MSLLPRADFVRGKVCSFDSIDGSLDYYNNLAQTNIWFTKDFSTLHWPASKKLAALSDMLWVVGQAAQNIATVHQAVEYVADVFIAPVDWLLLKESEQLEGLLVVWRSIGPVFLVRLAQPFY